MQRDDDRPETVRARLVVYHGNMEALVAHYRAQGLLREVPGQGAIEEVYANILTGLERAGGPYVLRSFFPQKPELKSPREIGLMREAGKLVAEALRLCRSMAKPGVKTIEIDQAVEALYRSRRAPCRSSRAIPGRVPFPGGDVHFASTSKSSTAFPASASSAKAIC